MSTSAPGLGFWKECLLVGSSIGDGIINICLLGLSEEVLQSSQVGGVDV